MEPTREGEMWVVYVTFLRLIIDSVVCFSELSRLKLMHLCCFHHIDIFAHSVGYMTMLPTIIMYAYEFTHALSVVLRQLQSDRSTNKWSD